MLDDARSGHPMTATCFEVWDNQRIGIDEIASEMNINNVKKRVQE